MSDIEVIKPKLYLDMDGVILPFIRSSTKLPFEMKQANGLEYYSPEVVRRSGKTCLSLVWCTTWESQELQELTDSMEALRGGSQLALPGLPDSATRISQKLDIIAADQTTNSSPFVWADDSITEVELRRTVDLFRDRPHLIIKPDSTRGLNEAQLSSIEDFARRYESSTK
jgi:hypothetical protein